VASFFQIRSYFTYWLNAVDQHSLHSPFFFDFYSFLVKGEDKHPAIAADLRKKLERDNRNLVVEDFGTGSKLNNVRKISSIAETSLSQPRFSAMFRRIIERYQHKTIIELGTSLGINTLYLAQNKDSKVYTFEGSKAIAELATLTFEFAGQKNIRMIQGNIDLTYPEFLTTIRKIDFLFVDANHTYQATLKYFTDSLAKTHEKTVIVIDDIHSSSAMEKAWKEIIENPLVHSSADLYRCGVLFFDPSLHKQHVILQF
jgi:predicted O-methyltransferase YrrM